MNTSDEIGAMFENAVTPFGKVNHIVQTGSRAYGLDTPDSDFDYRGIFVPNFSHLIGLKNCEQVKVNGDDWVCHSLPQFVKLVIKQNPTILEMLFIQPITVSYWTSKLIPHLKKLITKEVFKPYSAYIRSQLEKAKHRQPTEKRKELIDKYGYDTKFMSHVARLAIQGAVLLRTGSINVLLAGANRAAVMAIKTGALNKDEAIGLCETLDQDLHQAYKNDCVLPDSVDINEFEKEIYIPLLLEIIDSSRKV